MTDFTSLAIGGVSGLIAFIAVVVRMNRKKRTFEAEHRSRPLQTTTYFSQHTEMQETRELITRS